jgi:hypothetical protein
MRFIYLFIYLIDCLFVGVKLYNIIEKVREKKIEKKRREEKRVE